MTTRKTKTQNNHAMIQSGLTGMEKVLGKAHPLIETVRKLNNRIDTLESKMLHFQMETQIAIQERKRLIQEKTADKARDDKVMEKEVAKPLTLSESVKRRLWASAICEKKDESFDMGTFTADITKVRKIEEAKIKKGELYHIVLTSGKNYLFGDGNQVEAIFDISPKLMNRVDTRATVLIELPVEDGPRKFGWLVPLR